MKIHLVILEDRHIDTMVYPYQNKDQAIERAEEIASKHCRHPEDFEEEEIEGWLYYARYSCEGDSVRVVEAELKGDTSNLCCGEEKEISLHYCKKCGGFS